MTSSVERELFLVKFLHECVVFVVNLRPELLCAHLSQPLLDLGPHLELEASPLTLKNHGRDEAVGDGQSVAGQERRVLQVAALETLQLFREMFEAEFDEFFIRLVSPQTVLFEAAWVGQVVACVAKEFAVRPLKNGLDQEACRSGKPEAAKCCVLSCKVVEDCWAEMLN